MSIIFIKNPSGGALGTMTLWYGNVAALPAGYSIVTALKDLYVKGGSTPDLDPVGSNTHDHTNPDTNTVSNHTHGVTVGGTGGSTVNADANPATSGSSLAKAHSHNGGSGSAGSAGGHKHTVKNTVSADMRPSSRRLYWVKTFAQVQAPVGLIAFWSGLLSTIPAGWQLADGTNGTIDMRSRFILGASVDGDVNTTVGDLTHTHTNQTLDSGGAHTHGITGTIPNAGVTTTNNGFPAGAVSSAAGNHGHTFSGTAASDGAHDHTVNNTQSANHLPPFIQLFYIQKITSPDTLPTGVIVGWDQQTVPDGWKLCDGTNGTPDMIDKFVYGADDDGDLLAEGGALTHTHTYASPGTSQNGLHDHPVTGFSVGSSGLASDKAMGSSGGFPDSMAQNHTHSGSANVADNGDHTHTIGTTGSGSNVPRHVVLVFIMKET